MIESGVFSTQTFHGLGRVLNKKIYDTEEAIVESGLDWEVEAAPAKIVYKDKIIEVPNRKIIIRKDTEEVLCFRSNIYEPLQNRDAFTFFNPFLHEKDCFISSAIALSKGCKICICVEIENTEKEVVKGDTVKAYLIVATSHDGSIRTCIKFTTIRVVCANTLAIALSSAGEVKTVRHTKSQYTRLNQIQTSLNLYRQRFDDEVDLYKEMSRKPMNLEATRDYLENLFAKEIKEANKRKDDDSEPITVDNFRATKKCLDNFMFTPDLQLPGVANTAWAAFNAVTEMIKNKSSNQEKRVESIWFGPDSELINRAKHLVLV